MAYAAQDAILLCGKPLSSPSEGLLVAGIGIRIARTTPCALPVPQEPEGARSLRPRAIAQVAERASFYGNDCIRPNKRRKMRASQHTA